MNVAAAWLVIVTTAWSGDSSRGVEFPSMEACRQALSEMKTVDAKGAAVVAFCSPNKPTWWRSFELRKDDRGFSEGDVLCLREYDPHSQSYSGREIHRDVIHILRHRPDAACAATFGLQPGYVIMSIREPRL